MLTPALPAYAFPDTIDPAKQYLFYLHGKIIEDQGIPAVSPEYGEYEYEAILKKLSGYGFVVISEPRPKNTDGVEYAKKITETSDSFVESWSSGKEYHGGGGIKRRWDRNTGLTLA